MSIKRLAVMSSISLLLGACGILPSNPALQTYQLPAGSTPIQVSMSSKSLSIPEPYANRVINHQRVAVVLDSLEVQAYEGIRWEDTAPKVFRDRLVEDFRRANAYKTVLINDEQVTVDRSLRLDMQAFQLQYKEKKPYVVIAVGVTLINRLSGAVLAAETFHIEREVPNVNVDTIMPTFAQAVDQINADIISWTRQNDR